MSAVTAIGAMGPARDVETPPTSPADLPPEDMPLLALLHRLADAGFGFTAMSPLSHRRVLLRRRGRGRTLGDIFGLNMPFDPAVLDPTLLQAMAAAGILERRRLGMRSKLRVASIGHQLFLHSPFPPRGTEHVFFGPDSYRFADFLRGEIAGTGGRGARILDIGAGSGVGGVVAAGLIPRSRLLLADINPQALRLARINAAFAGLAPDLQRCDGVPATGVFDLAVANPPYILGSGLTYSDGGGGLGSEITLRWAASALERLAPGGRLLLYSGSAIVAGHDALKARLCETAARTGCGFSYREVDADMFPTTLLKPSYWRVERIAAVAAVFAKPA